MLKFLPFFFLLFLSYAEATPQFARETNLSCLSCHTSVPMLNAKGRAFLENDFTFYKQKTTLSHLLHQDVNERYIPLAVIAGLNYSSATTKFKPEIKILSGGTLHEDVAYFIGKSKYLSYKTPSKTHKLRGGILSVFTPVSSIGRIPMATGMQCNEDDCDVKYKTPLQHLQVGLFKGIEYSFNMPNMTLALSVGKTLDNLAKMTCIDDEDRDNVSQTAFSVALRYDLMSGFRIGGIYEKLPDSLLTQESGVVFLERNFEVFSLYLSMLYKDNYAQNYFGSENMLTYKTSENSLVKLTASVDEIEHDMQNYSYSVGGDYYLNHLIFNLSGGRRYYDNSSEDIYKLSAKIYF
jgi:hypothetical protein